ncbi:hypothetical protein GmHk_20G057070 [Glycine max]|nr:hypothetical protein GmHk_20G057070 [Glycine max]
MSRNLTDYAIVPSLASGMLQNFTYYALTLPFDSRHVAKLHGLPNNGCQVPQSGQAKVASQQIDGPRMKLGYLRMSSGSPPLDDERHRMTIDHNLSLRAIGHDRIWMAKDVVWSKDLSAYFLCFLQILDREFSFFCVLVFSHSLIGNFLLLLSFLFSSKGKVYVKLGFWLKACRTAGHDICQGLASGSGIKGMSHIISMIRMQQ